MIADICHNLPANLTSRPDSFDPFGYLWQTANDHKRQWLAAHSGKSGQHGQAMWPSDVAR